ncbi:MAG: ATP-dependent DNA helicase RecG, partial [Eggerthellaceae bacterium]|nr:ATP-dependent DNA helicase RecG [Eggerthellaceae bacterium]
QVFPSARVALLHGRLAAEEKSAIMEAFRAGEIDVLVSTTIIEVGIDVPNATVMIIEDADRFGLAQLHQLRGRVGRGEKPGQVYLVTRSKAPAALERLRAMEVTEDGFELSEIDLAQRKEGDVFGARQHGQAALRLVNVVRDRAVIEAAYQDAYDIIYNDTLSEAERAILERERSMVACRLNKERN